MVVVERKEHIEQTKKRVHIVSGILKHKYIRNVICMCDKVYSAVKSNRERTCTMADQKIEFLNDSEETRDSGSLNVDPSVSFSVYR